MTELSEYLVQAKANETPLSPFEFETLAARVKTEPTAFVENLDAIAELLTKSLEQPKNISARRVGNALIALFQPTREVLFPGIAGDDLEDNPRYLAYGELQAKLKEYYEQHKEDEG